jgi:flagellum-specific peptidoglycan hydrolase FlgJ
VAPDWGDVAPLAPEHPFLQELAPAAARIEEEFSIPAQVILAQAAVESAMGSSRIGNYNVFGIKGSGSRGSLLLATTEYRRGRKEASQAYFANYGSWEEALRAHAELFKNPAYEKAMAHRGDPMAFARALTGVYATDPHYGEKLVQTMRDQGLIPDQR